MSAEDFEFCGTICMAARNLKIYGRIEQMDGGFAFRWFDPMANGINWLCEISVDKQLAILSACKSLVEYLSFKNKENA